MLPLGAYLAVGAALFVIGAFGALARKSAVAILIGLELMFNAALLNAVAFWRYLHPQGFDGTVFAIVILAVAAAEVAVGLALFIAVYRRFGTSDADQITLLKG